MKFNKIKINALRKHASDNLDLAEEKINLLISELREGDKNSHRYADAIDDAWGDITARYEDICAHVDEVVSDNEDGD